MNVSPEPARRLAAFGNQLIDVHIRLREELARLRDTAGSGGSLRDLRTHCLTFCSALTTHHTGEDDTAFPVLAAEFPDLRPVLEELRRDHVQVAALMRSLETLLSDDSPPDRDVRTELDTLSALLESHFTYEEKRIAAALDSLPPSTWTAPTFLNP
ncbi:hemerythrin domain-containing protein [Nonomuraea spiralis]|uniref:hemerythrin domain-containing protein n=1 Tax=Nonomuraea TaxID=83681 RepID=UPI000F7A119C|nr:hemerythrin domain-containing protein [Nonomuraea sp. WAC 01424]RSN04098.1 hemerythrin [Nonomuraea sp. WAC 01424]